MTLFFLVVGLEARREFDMGELRERKRVSLPVLAGVGGMLVPVADLPGVNAGGGAAHGWGIAMSTDTALRARRAGAGRRRGCPTRLRVFLLTVVVVDDLVALVVIAIVYTDHVDADAAR